MTYIEKAISDPRQRAKWKIEALRIATHLKSKKDWGDKTKFKVGVCFDDQIVTVELDVALIARLSTEALADTIFDGVLQLQTDHRAAGESADPAVTGSGMECGHAPQQDSAEQGEPLAGRIPAPAAAAVSERCRRRLEPDFTQNCPNEATGGYRLTLHAAPAIQKRWGRRSMLSLIVDLPVCAECFAKSTVFDVTDEQLRANLNKTAQRLNQGILVDWKQTELDHVPFGDHEYQILLRQTTGQRAIDSQPAPAGPQPEGAGDGNRSE